MRAGAGEHGSRRGHPCERQHGVALRLLRRGGDLISGEICMVYAWYVHGVCMVCAWYMHGICMVCAWYMHCNMRAFIGIIRYMHSVYAWCMRGVCVVYALHGLCVCVVYA